MTKGKKSEINKVPAEFLLTSGQPADKQIRGLWGRYPDNPIYQPVIRRACKMYENFFGFKERPFQLVPNPAYLFLSRCHEEALAHLNYAVSQGDGFVEITGEVGTGKTTLCRVFLENLGNDTEAAYIFNPKLDAIQLIKAINDELGVNSEGKSIKKLIDRLNFFLMEKKAEGKKVILVIDEAQNLSKEVLEQLRLLSNLETNTAKLLQIILFGQPELREMLDSHELRQLAQRITLSYHLVPLNFKETKEYIEHRLRIASRKTGIKFTWAALRAVYTYSGGTPRLINIACDRSILTAYGLNQYKVTGNIAAASIRELAGRGDVRRRSLREGNAPLLIFSGLCVLLLLLILYPVNYLDLMQLFDNTESKTATASKSHPSKKEIPVSSVPAPAKSDDSVVAETTEPRAGSDENTIADTEAAGPEPVAEAVESLDEFLRNSEPRASRTAALKVLLDLWDTEGVIKPYLENMEDDESFFRLGTTQNGLLLARADGDLELVRKLNLPAVLVFHSPAGIPIGYLPLVRFNDTLMTFRDKNKSVKTESDEVELYWSGAVYIPWKNFFAYPGVIPRDTSDDAVVTLKMLLRDIGFGDIEINTVYDDQAKEAVEKIQEKHGLRVDGVVGPLTKIILYNEMKSLAIPHIGSEN